MPTRLTFDLPAALYLGVPVAGILLGMRARMLLAAGHPLRRWLPLIGLRALALLGLVVLLARPVVVAGVDPQGPRTVALLVDHSKSMALLENGQTRYGRALALARDGLFPVLGRHGYKVRLFSFAETARATTLSEAAQAAVDGRETDLAEGILEAAGSVDPRPAAVVALTDGAANRSDHNQAAMLALLESGTPFIGVGLGDDVGVPTLSLVKSSAPDVVPPHQAFRVSAQLQAVGGQVPDFDLLLLRDGQLAQSRRVVSDKSGASRFWSEGFDVMEDTEATHQYTVQVRLPAPGRLVMLSDRSTAPVRIGKEKDFRVLFVQGGLTWDFKFIGRALKSDPGVRVTGLSRTSGQSVFRQNVESAEELSGGFPQDLAGLAPYRVIVLSDMKPRDLTPAQQDLIARFCAELGGGVLLLGGEESFDGSWQGSRLEQLLPVTFDTGGGVRGLDRPFHLRLTDEAARSPVFQVADDGSSRRVWDGLPTFTRYGRVLREKPGAVVWARHDQDSGPGGPRVLMASQYYGNGLSAVVCIQSLWRWRLAKQSDPQTFDRFWRQFFRFLGQSGRQDFQIQLEDQDLRTHADVGVVVEKRPRPDPTAAGAGDAADEYTLRVSSPLGRAVLEQKARLTPLKPLRIRFRAEEEGTYTVAVEDGRRARLSSQAIEIRDVDREMEHTGRDMENLRQWAALSGGEAFPAEEVDADRLAVAVQSRLEALSRAARRRTPWGIDGFTLAVLLAALCGEWALRKRWGLP